MLHAIVEVVLFTNEDLRIYYRTVFRHNGVRELQVSSHSLKIRQNAAGYEDHPDPVGTKFDQRGPDIRIEHAIARYCPVVIECQNTEFQ